MKALGFFQHSSSCQRPHVRPSNMPAVSLAGQVTSLRQQTKLLEVRIRWLLLLPGAGSGYLAILMDHVAPWPNGPLCGF